MAEPKRHMDVPKERVLERSTQLLLPGSLDSIRYTNKNATNRERWWRFKPSQVASIKRLRSSAP
jgi:hypothetical protein